MDRTKIVNFSKYNNVIIPILATKKRETYWFLFFLYRGLFPDHIDTPPLSPSLTKGDFVWQGEYCNRRTLILRNLVLNFECVAQVLQFVDVGTLLAARRVR